MEQEEVFFAEEGYYHLRHLTNEQAPLFKIDGNYMFFLQRLKKFTEPVVDLYAYCLLPQHFHLVVHVHDRETVFNYFLEQYPEASMADFSVHSIVMAQLNQVLEQYTQAYNRMFKREGVLFTSPPTLEHLTTPDAVCEAIQYVHFNPVQHGAADAPRDWKNSSFNDIVRENRTFKAGDQVLALFGNKDTFIESHQQPPQAQFLNRLTY